MTATPVHNTVNRFNDPALTADELQALTDAAMEPWKYREYRDVGVPHVLTMLDLHAAHISPDCYAGYIDAGITTLDAMTNAAGRYITGRMAYEASQFGITELVDIERLLDAPEDWYTVATAASIGVTTADDLFMLIDAGVSAEMMRAAEAARVTTPDDIVELLERARPHRWWQHQRLSELYAAGAETFGDADFERVLLTHPYPHHTVKVASTREGAWLTGWLSAATLLDVQGAVALIEECELSADDLPAALQLAGFIQDAA